MQADENTSEEYQVCSVLPRLEKGGRIEELSQDSFVLAKHREVQSAVRNWRSVRQSSSDQPILISDLRAQAQGASVGLSNLDYA